MLKGKSMTIKVGTDGTVWNSVLGIKSASMKNGASNNDISTFGDTFIGRLQGLKDCSYSLSGFYDSTDTTGQTVIRDAWLNDTTLWVGFLPDGSAGFEQEVKVSSFEISGEVNGVVELSIELEGTGAIATYA